MLELSRLEMFNTQRQTGRQVHGQWGRRGVQELRALATLAEDPSSVPSTHTRELTTDCDTNSRGSNALSAFGGSGTQEHILPTLAYIYMP